MLRTLAFTALVGIVVCKPFWETKLEKCPDFEPQKDFNLTAFLGVWHEIERYPNQYEIMTSCVVSNYEVTDVDAKGCQIKFG